MKRFYTYTLLFLALLFCAPLAYSQSYTASNPYVSTEGVKHSFTEGNTTLTITMSDDETVTQLLDNATMVAGVPIAKPNEKKEVPFWAGKIGGVYYVLYYLAEKELKIIAREVTFQTGVLGRETVTVLTDVAEVEHKDIACIASRVGKRFIIRYKLKSKNTRSSYRIHYFEGSLSRISQNTITLPFEENDLTIDNEVLDSKGNFYISTTQSDNKYTKQYYAELTKYKTELLKFPYEQPEAVIITPVPDSGMIAQYYLFELTGGKLMCAGVNNPSEYRPAKHVLLYQVNSNGQLQQKGVLPVPLFDTNQVHYPGRTSVSFKLGLTASATNFTIDQVLEDADGTYTLIGQERYVQAEWTRGINGTKILAVDGKVGSIIAYRMWASGEPEWVSQLTIPAFYRNFQKLKPTYRAASYKKGIALLFLDGPFIFSMAKSNAEGKFSSSPVLDLKNAGERNTMTVSTDRLTVLPSSILTETNIKGKKSIMYKVDLGQ